MNYQDQAYQDIINLRCSPVSTTRTIVSYNDVRDEFYQMAINQPARYLAVADNALPSSSLTPDELKSLIDSIELSKK